MKHVSFYRKTYPRPSFVREHFLLLNGGWSFSFDDQKIGEKERWFEKEISDKTINVPFSYQTKQSFIEEDIYHEVLWYQTKFKLTEKEREKKVLLHLDGLDYQGKIWVNGIFVGSIKGAYFRHTLDISAYIKADNLLTIETVDDYQTTQLRGKQKWLKDNFGCWYQETNGLYKDVWLEFVSDTYLKHVSLRAVADKQLLNLQYELNQLKEDLEIETVIKVNGNLIHQSKFQVIKNEIIQAVDIKSSQEVFKVAAWSDSHPNVFEIKYRLYHHQVLIDEIDSYYAYRDWQTKDGHIYLNQGKMYLKMILDQGYEPSVGLSLTPDLLESDVKTIKEMGFNGVRKHQIIADERFYYYCDVYGLFTWLELPSAYEYTPLMKNEIIRSFEAILKQYENYGSIMTYVIFNESWGITNISNNKDQQRLTEGLYYLAKSFDSTRFVIANDGWEHTKTDLLTIHDYTQDSDLLKLAYQDIKSKMNVHNLSQLHRPLFVKGYTYENQPIIMSEFAGIASSLDAGWGYGDKVKNNEDFIKRLESLVKAIKANHDFIGYCITQLTDVEQESNGLLYADRKFKISTKKMKEINCG